MCVHIVRNKDDDDDSTIFYYDSITLSASYDHVTFVASRSCQNLVGLA